MEIILTEDGEYYPYSYQGEDELESMVVEHSMELFGESSLFLCVKKEIASRKGIGGIPDGYLADLSDIENPAFYIVEIELSSHPVFEHVISQVGRFDEAFSDPTSKRTIRDLVLREVGKDIQKKSLVQAKLDELSERKEIHEFVDGLVYGDYSALVVIDEKNDKLESACNRLTTNVEILEFRTYKKLDPETGPPDHIHLFTPLNPARMVDPVQIFFDRVVDSLRSKLPEGFRDFDTNKTPTNYRQVLMPGWRHSQHFEVLVDARNIEVGLHLENENLRETTIFPELIQSKDVILAELGDNVKIADHWKGVYESRPRVELDDNLVEEISNRLRDFVMVLTPIVGKIQGVKK